MLSDHYDGTKFRHRCRDDYQVPFSFTGTLEKLTLNIDCPQLSPNALFTATLGAEERIDYSTGG